jgi:hypothetical protein
VLGFFYVNDNVEVDFGNTHIMHCIFCYQNLVIGINLRTQMKKGLVSYCKTNGMKIL